MLGEYIVNFNILDLYDQKKLSLFIHKRSCLLIGETIAFSQKRVLGARTGAT